MVLQAPPLAEHRAGAPGGLVTGAGASPIKVRVPGCTPLLRERHWTLDIGPWTANFRAARAIGAVVAQQLYTLWVGGSNPSSPTNFKGKAEKLTSEFGSG
jgi:hypothetical protein